MPGVTSVWNLLSSTPRTSFCKAPPLPSSPLRSLRCSSRLACIAPWSSSFCVPLIVVPIVPDNSSSCFPSMPPIFFSAAKAEIAACLASSICCPRGFAISSLCVLAFLADSALFFPKKQPGVPSLSQLVHVHDLSLDLVFNPSITETNEVPGLVTFFPPSTGQIDFLKSL